MITVIQKMMNNFLIILNKKNEISCVYFHPVHILQVDV